MRARPIFSWLVAVATATAVTACGGASSNSIASDSASQIVARATRAVEDVSSVHVQGAFTAGSNSRDTITLDLHLVAGRGARGSMTENGGGFDLIVNGSTVYVKGSAAFWKQYGGQRTAKLAGRWLRSSGTSGAFGALASQVRAKSLLATLLSGHGGLTRGGTSTVDGHEVIAVHDPSKGGTLYVATTGPPYPIELVNGSDRSKLTFSAFDAPVSLAAPAGAVSTSALTR